ncbi:alpha/beta fold hydrolase [Ramlibacter albus]|uniref:Alpha/beta hydrolase n=1 Tax=Ramlibacter albus TaxID=2079448 RepID=A0A923M6L2_9BURK|nr:alpha/beta hydrolase [Ramlibacter albus]MBC5763532.1 alpha/beta hydrolase [Ramlibacter albus]
MAGVLINGQVRLASAETQARAQAAPAGALWFQAHDTRIHAREWGRRDAPPLLLVHGTGAWAGTWVSNAQAMADAGFRVVAIDLPPFGYSELPANGDYSRIAQARRIQAVAAQLGPQPVTLLGHSFGGGPSAEAAMLDPSRIAHLVLVDAAIGLQGDEEKPCENPAVAEAVLGWPGLRTALVGATATEPHLTQHWLRQFVARTEVITPARAAIYQQPFTVQHFSAGLGDWARQFALGCERPASVKPRSYRAYASPVTLVWGAEDTVTPLAQAQALKAQLPRVRLVVLPGVGHIPQIEDVTLFNTRIVEVLRTLP